MCETATGNKSENQKKCECLENFDAVIKREMIFEIEDQRCNTQKTFAFYIIFFTFMVMCIACEAENYEKNAPEKTNI